MSLADVVRRGVAVADRVTDDLQATLQYERWIAQTTYGTPSFAPVAPIRALIDRRQTTRRLHDGREVVIEATIVVPRTVSIGLKDRLTFADGARWPILQVQGTVDPANPTGGPYATEILVGNVGIEKATV